MMLGFPFVLRYPVQLLHVSQSMIPMIHECDFGVYNLC